VTRVLLTRANEDGERTAEKLRQLGIEPLLSPVLEVVATGAAIPRGAFDVVLATSAKALENAGEELSELRDLPLHAVGRRTAQTAERFGLRADIVAANAQTFLPLLRERYERPTRFLYFAGRDRRDELEKTLRAKGHSVAVVETYEARAARALTDAAAAALKAGEVGAVLHYSKRSAEIFLDLVRAARLIEKLRGVAQLALSPEVAKPLSGAGLARVLVAEKPDEEHLLRLLPKLRVEDASP
jgi:uroporphyrinogen-III synthase